MATGAGNHPVPANSNQYQRHIDGLRAVAVLSVIFYHFGQTTFSGGFVGVDVFFVISGYLITNLIINEINQGLAVSISNGSIFAGCAGCFRLWR